MEKEIHSIIRVEKIKTTQQLNARSIHNHRLQDVPNADPKRDIKRLIGTSDIVSDVKTYLIEKGIDPEKLRINAVLCNELILTLSPDFFCDGILNYKDKFNKANTLEFVKSAMKFLEDTYGDRLINVVLHLDETSPHIHAIVVPVYKDASSGSFKLAARRFFDRPQLKLLQQRYCAAFKHLNSYKVTYTRNSKARHQDIQKFYSSVNQTKLDFEAQLRIKDEKIKKLQGIRTKLKRELRHYEAIVSSSKKLIKKLKTAVSIFPSEFTDKVYEVLNELLFNISKKYDDEQQEYNTVQYPGEKSDLSKSIDKILPTLKPKPPSPYTKPKPK